MKVPVVVGFQLATFVTLFSQDLCAVALTCIHFGWKNQNKFFTILPSNASQGNWLHILCSLEITLFGNLHTDASKLASLFCYQMQVCMQVQLKSNYHQLSLRLATLLRNGTLLVTSLLQDQPHHVH